jgi:hypothetical protein
VTLTIETYYGSEKTRMNGLWAEGAKYPKYVTNY